MNLGFQIASFLWNIDAALLTLDVGELVGNMDGSDTTAFGELESKVQSTGFGIYRLIGVIACVGFIIAGAWAFFKMFFIASPQEKQEAKSNMLYKVLAVIGFFAIPGIIVLLSGVGQNLFN